MKPYVKSTITSGSGDQLAISQKKSASISNYTTAQRPNIESAPRYIHTTDASLTMTNPICYIGSNTKTAYFDSMTFNVDGLIDPSFLGAEKHATIKFELLRANITGSTTGSSSYARSAICKTDSNDPTSSISIAILPTGITNEEKIFSGYFHCSSVAAKPLWYSNSIKLLTGGADTGKKVSIAGTNQALIIRYTAISESTNYLYGSIYTSWYEI